MRREMERLRKEISELNARDSQVPAYATEPAAAVPDRNIDMAQLFLSMAQQVHGDMPGSGISLGGTVASVLLLSREQLAELDEIAASVLYGLDSRQTVQKNGTILYSADSLKPPEQVFRAFFDV